MLQLSDFKELCLAEYSKGNWLIYKQFELYLIPLGVFITILTSNDILFLNRGIHKTAVASG